MKNNSPQLELFTQTKGQSTTQSDPAKRFLDYIWAYEKTVLIVICFIASGIISYALGVEKGKKLSTVKTNASLDVAAVKTQKNNLPQEAATRLMERSQYQPVLQKGDLDKSPEQKAKPQNYTIQLASYKTRTYAQKEAELLKKRGLAPQVMPKGKYIILCVGNFQDKQTAKTLLTEMQKRYAGCFLRRL
jgi:hypothetical protein